MDWSIRIFVAPAVQRRHRRRALPVHRTPTAIVAHPLLRRLARGLVWTVDDRTAAVDPLGDLVTIDGALVTDPGWIRIAHPASSDLARGERGSPSVAALRRSPSWIAKSTRATLRAIGTPSSARPPCTDSCASDGIAAPPDTQRPDTDCYVRSTVTPLSSCELTRVCGPYRTQRVSPINESRPSPCTPPSTTCSACSPTYHAPPAQNCFASCRISRLSGPSEPAGACAQPLTRRSCSGTGTAASRPARA
jgi:hypothetical protein